MTGQNQMIKIVELLDFLSFCCIEARESIISKIKDIDNEVSLAEKAFEETGLVLFLEQFDYVKGKMAQFEEKLIQLKLNQKKYNKY